MPSVVNETNFQQEVLKTPNLVVVHFWTPWCDLCKLIAPVLETIQKQHQEIIKLVSINADENFKLANIYRLRTVPTIMLFDNGELVTKLDNFTNRDHLKHVLEKIINSNLSLS